MKRLSLFIALLTCTLFAQAQYTPVKGLMSIYGSSGGLTVTNGTTPAAKAASAIVDYQSTSLGFLAPRMTTAERNAIASPADGLLVYDITLNAFYVADGGTWSAIGGGDWSLTGNAGTDPNVNFIGTTDSVGFVILNATADGYNGTESSIFIIGQSYSPIKGVSIEGNSDSTGIGTSIIGGGVLNGIGTYISGTRGSFGTGGVIDTAAIYMESVSEFGIGTVIKGATHIPAFPDIKLIPDSGKLQIVNIGEGAGKVLTSDATGMATWAASGITVGTTTITSGADNRILFQDATANDFVTQLANFTMGSVASGFLDVPTGYALGGTKLISKVGSVLTIGSAPNATGNNSVIINPYNSPTTVTVSDVTYVGSRTNELAQGAKSCAFGYKNDAGGDYSIVVGWGNYGGISTGNTGSIIIGAETSVNNTAHTGVLGGGTINGYISNWYLNGMFSASPYSVVLNACGGSGTTVAGGSITIAGGKGTAAAIPGSVSFQTSKDTTAAGVILQKLTDRYKIIGKITTLTETAATSFFSLSVPTSTVTGGNVVCTVEANDGTDFQSRNLSFDFAAVNKTGTITAVLSTPVETVAVSAGTLTVAITAVDSGSGVLTFKADATSSLTQTVLRINAQVCKNLGTGTIAAQ